MIRRSPGLGRAEESVVYTGAMPLFVDRRMRVGQRYTYALTAVDAAGNASTASVKVTFTRLVAPAAGASATAPPLLRWNPVRRADYYNVRLFRDGHRMLSAWPRRHRFQLHRRWHFGGAEHRLRPGRHRWLRWAGSGPRSRNRYGPLLGTRSFTVVRR